MVAGADINSNHGNQHPVRHKNHHNHHHYLQNTTLTRQNHHHLQNTTENHHNHPKMDKVPQNSILAALSGNRTGFNMPETRPPNIVPMATSPPPPSGIPTGPQCDGIDMKYDIAPAVICAVCFVFGLLYCFFGKYRMCRF